MQETKELWVVQSLLLLHTANSMQSAPFVMEIDLPIEADSWRICCIESSFERSWKQMPCTVSMKPPVTVKKYSMLHESVSRKFSNSCFGRTDLLPNLWMRVVVNPGILDPITGIVNRVEDSRHSKWSWWCLLGRTLTAATFPSWVPLWWRRRRLQCNPSNITLVTFELSGKPLTYTGRLLLSFERVFSILGNIDQKAWMFISLSSIHSYLAFCVVNDVVSICLSQKVICIHDRQLELKNIRSVL